MKCNYKQRVRIDKLTMTSEAVRKRTHDNQKKQNKDGQTDTGEKERCPGAQGNKETASTYSVRRTTAAATIEVR